MVFYIKDGEHTFALEDTFGICNGTLVMNGLKYKFSDDELDEFMECLGCQCTNYQFKDPSCLYKVNPYGPYFSDL